MHMNIVRPFVESFLLLSIEDMENDGAFLNAFTECAHKIYENDPNIHDKSSVQLSLYKNKARSFERDMMIGQMKSFS